MAYEGTRRRRRRTRGEEEERRWERGEGEEEEEEKRSRRPEESLRQTSRQASKQASRQASKQASKQAKRARSPHEWLGCRTGATVVGVGACSRPAAASFTILFPPRPLAQIPRTPLEFHTSCHRRSRYPPPL